MRPYMLEKWHKIAKIHFHCKRANDFPNSCRIYGKTILPLAYDPQGGVWGYGKACNMLPNGI